MKMIIASGPVIIKKGKLLVIKDKKDDFYKIPGGTVKGKDSLEETCLREFNEETGLKCRIVKKLSTLKLNKNPQTKEAIKIKLYHYQCELVGPVKNYRTYNYNGHSVKWVKVKDLLSKKYNVAPNIKFLVKKGDIK